MSKDFHASDVTVGGSWYSYPLWYVRARKTMVALLAGICGWQKGRTMSALRTPIACTRAPPLRGTTCTPWPPCSLRDDRAPRTLHTTVRGRGGREARRLRLNIEFWGRIISQSVSQCILGNRLSCVFTKRSQHAECALCLVQVQTTSKVARKTCRDKQPFIFRSSHMNQPFCLMRRYAYLVLANTHNPPHTLTCVVLHYTWHSGQIPSNSHTHSHAHFLSLSLSLALALSLSRSLSHSFSLSHTHRCITTLYTTLRINTK